VAALAPTAAVVVVAIGAITASAHAATVSVEVVPPEFSPDENVLRFDAGPGETNLVHAVASQDLTSGRTRVLVTDDGAPLAAGDGCTTVDSHTADCVAPDRPGSYPLPLDAIFVLGDGNDAVTAGAATLQSGVLSLFGGDGDDQLTVGPGPGFAHSRLAGGTGSDMLHAGANGSTLDGGPDADEIVGGPAGDLLRDGDLNGTPAADSIDGGGGADTIEYRSRTSPVIVDLAVGRGGAPGENDRLVNVEDIRGGRGSDALLGNALHNFIQGGGGGDRVAGRGGSDLLVVGNGGRVSGGRGDDSVRVRDRTRVACGPGAHDSVAVIPGAPRPPRLRRDCERIVSGLVVDPRATFDGPAIRLQVACPDCSAGVVTVKTPYPPTAVLARRAFHLSRRRGSGDFSGVVHIPWTHAHGVRGALLRFVVRAGPYRTAWITRVPS
jgi:RTX calcium-binding nonapeptide repeat (4 copies)